MSRGTKKLRRLRPAAFAVLVAVAALHTESGQWPTFPAVAQRAGMSSAVYYVTQLAGFGLLKRDLGKGIKGITKAGLALLAAGQEFATARPAALPPADGPLPATAPVTPQGLVVLRAMHEHAKAGRALAMPELAAELGIEVSAVRTRLYTLRNAGLLARDRATASTDGGVLRLTAVAVGVLDGRVQAVNGHHARSAAAKARKAEKAKPRRRVPVKAAPAPRPVLVAPPPPPRPIAHTPDAAPLPPPVLPALSPAVATFRGIRHPLPPLAHAKPKGLVGVTWNDRTTLPAMRRA